MWFARVMELLSQGAEAVSSPNVPSSLKTHGRRSRCLVFATRLTSSPILCCRLSLTLFNAFH